MEPSPTPPPHRRRLAPWLVLGTFAAVIAAVRKQRLDASEAAFRARHG